MKYLGLLSLFATFSLAVSARIPRVTQKVILDIEIGGVKAGKIEIGLFGKIVPITVKNIVELCKNPLGEGYKGSKFHYVVRDSLVQTGFFTEEDGSAGLSYYRRNFERENFELKHYGAGWVAMGNTHIGYVNTQFYIILKKKESLDGEYVVFGKVVRGMDVVRKIANVETDDYRRPIKDVVIADCTAANVKKPYAVELIDATE